MKTFFRVTKLFTVLFVVTAGSSFALDDGQALTPPMGWNSWNWFGCSDRNHGTISTQMMLEMGRAMVESGMKDAGYEYINIDDCWANLQRDRNGGLVSIQRQFPSIKELADSIHAMGLKLGIYTDLWEFTCAQQYGGNGFPGLYGHEQQDADTFVAWGVDYVKIDFCLFEGHREVTGSDAESRRRGAANQYSIAKEAFKAAHERALAAGKNPRPIVISVCEWGRNDPYLWADTVGHLWRIETDIAIRASSFMAQVNKALDLSRYAGPGHWNDPDMMQVGNGLRPNEDRVHFGLWCLLAAPLIAGNDLRNMNNTTTELLTNKELVAVNQDSLGHQAVKVISTASTLVAAKKMNDSSFAVGFINRGNSNRDIKLTWNQLSDALGVTIPSDQKFSLRDLMAHEDLGSFTDEYSSSVPSWDIHMFRMYPTVATRRAAPGSAPRPALSLNRASNILTVSTSTVGPVSFDIIDVLGKTVRTQNVITSGTWQISTKGMVAGLYFVRMRTNGNYSLERFMIN